VDVGSGDSWGLVVTSDPDGDVLIVSRAYLTQGFIDLRGR